MTRILLALAALCLVANIAVMVTLVKRCTFQPSPTLPLKGIIL